MEMNFLEELLQEVEQKEGERDEAYFDLLLLQIKQINNQISYNFSQAEKECSMINSFVLHKNTQLQERVKWLELKLEAFIKEKNEKTITLPNGTLRCTRNLTELRLKILSCS